MIRTAPACVFPRRLWSLVLLVAVCGATSVAGQTRGSIEEARRLRDLGRYGPAADTLIGYLRSHPGEAGVHWMAAQLLHSDGRTELASEQYDAALMLTPGDAWLRVEYGEFLLETGSWDRGAVVVLPLVENAGAPVAARARAQALLGTRAYWRGDLPQAIRHFEATLAIEPGSEGARRQLDEIRASLRPWIESAAEVFDDSQPYRRYHAILGGGAWLTPLWAVGVRGEEQTLDGETVRHARDALIEVRATFPNARASITARVGTAHQSDLFDAAIGRGEVRFQLGGGAALRAIADRTRYLWTPASADTLLMVNGIELRLDRAGAPRWAGEVALRRESLADANVIVTAYGWALAPLGRAVRAGYAFSWQDARESRWSSLLGRYDPYFTPAGQGVHTLLGELSARARHATARLNGSWGFHATEETPADQPTHPGRGVGLSQTSLSERSFTPWKVRGSVEGARLGGLELRMEAERESTAFYRLTRASITALYRFGASTTR